MLAGRGPVLASASCARAQQERVSHMTDARENVRGMLTLEELRTRMNAGDIETVVVGFTDHYGRLMGKRYRRRDVRRDVVQDGAHGCDYLLTTDMEMEPVPGYRFANWELGYGDFHLVPDFETLRVASWLDRLGARPVRRERRRRTTTSRSRRDRFCERKPSGAGAGLRRVRRLRAGALSLPQELRCATQGQRLRDLDSGGLVSRGLSHPAGHAHRGLPRRRAAPPEGLRRAGRELQRRMGPRAARSERALRRGARRWPTVTSSSSSA